ncbi:proliferation marker protein Ki-67-like isoform X1 [Montipora capricornis]|uniref:proliferation marker protein Ki-67-like isoform X1 n=2 Tax=Montipora capricornis TaxID=246305 RepID=UPI0035F1AAE6
MSGDIVAKIVVIKRNGTDGPQFPLRSNTCLFGRKADCDIRIQLPNVSQEHALVKVECDKKINITNLSSCNQTLVNGRPVSQVDIQHLDVLTISDRSFRFELPLSVQKQVRPLETQQHQSSTLTTTPQGKKTPKMPTPKGSPRTPPTGGTLKENIWALHRHSMPLPEEEEGLASPADVKVPFSSLDINVDPKEGSVDVQPGNEMKSEVAQKPKRRSKRVSFGPVLSPEQFDKDLPPATPVRRGATPKRHSTGGGKFVNTSSSSAKKRRSVAVLPCADPIVEEEFDTLKSTTPQTPELSQPNHEFQDNEERPETSSISRTFDDQDLRESIHEINTPTGSRRSSLRSARRSPSCPEHQMNIKDVLKDIRPHSLEFCQPNQEFQEIEQLPRNSELGELNESTLEVSTPSGNRRTSLRLAGTSPGFPVDHTVPECQSWLVSSDDIEEEEDETILDSDDYTSEEDENDGGEWCSDQNKDLANSEVQDVKNRMVTPLRKEIARGFQLRKTKKKMNTLLKKEIVNGIQLRQTKKKMNTPLRKEIADGIQLRETKKKMNTPLRKEIADGIQLRETKKKMNTPLRKEIADGIELRETKKKMNTPLRKEIADGIQLRETKKKMNTPLRKEIADGIELRETKKKMNTPLRKEIADGIQLRETKKKMNTPLRKEIADGIQLRETKKKMNTPLRKEIADGIQLRETKKKMNTPLRKEIADGIQLRETKKKMNTPLRKEIADGIQLRETKKKMNTPLRKEIADGIQLRETKKKMNTPLRKEIADGIQLRETKKKMNTPLRKEIADGIQLRRTKRKMKTPLRREIVNGIKLRQTRKKMNTPLRMEIAGEIQLRKTKKKINTPLRKQIADGMQLRQTKKKLPSPLQKDLQAQPRLRETKKKLATPVKKEIESKPQLRQTVKSMNAHLQDEIKAGVKLRETKQTMPLDLQIEIIKGKKLKPTKKSLPSPVKKAINNGLPALKQTSNKSSKRKRSEDEAPMITQPKKRKLSLSDEKDCGTQRAVKTPVRKEIPTQPKLRATRHRLATPVRKQIHSMPTLRAVRHKSFSVSATKKALRKPTYAEIVKRAKKTSVMNEVAKTKPKAASITGVAAMTKLGTLQSQENQVESEMSTRSPRRKRSHWMSSLALAVGGVKTRETQLEDFQGLSELFQSPPADQLPAKRSSKKQKAGNWLSSLAKATNGRRKRGTPITDLDGIPEMFFTPPCDIRRVESIEDPPNSVSPSDEELPMEEALIPTKTPSLTRPGKDTIAVEIATPVNTTPQESLELVQPVALSRTPSLRHSVKDVVSIKMVPPIQVSRTPSLRSDMIPASVVSSQVVETEQSNFQTSIEPSKTPSLRSSGDVQTVLRKSIGNSRKRIENARKSTKHNNAVENYEDFFVPNMFASPKPQPKRYSRKSEGLQGVARLLRTPEDKEKAIVSPKLDGIKEMMNVKDLKSPNFVGLRVLMKTPKSSSSVDDEEEHFNSELFDAKAVEEDRSQLSDDSTDVTVAFEQVIDLTSPENKMSEANQLVDVDVRPLVGITRAKRSAPQDLTEPLPKRSRRTRLANTRNVFSHPKAVVKKQTSRQKRKSVAVAQTTPEPFVFKRTQLDPIIEVPSPVRSISISSPEDQASHSQIRTRSGNKMKTEAIPPLKSSLPGKFVSSQTESSFDSSTEEITKTRSGTGKKIKIARAPVKARSTRNSRRQDASSLDIVSFKKTTATHIYVAERDVDETSLNIPIRRSRRTCNIVEEDSSVLENSETKRNTPLSNNLQKSEHIMNLRKTRSRAVEVMNVDLSVKTQKESSRLEDAKTTLRTREKIDGDTSLSRMTKSLRDEENLSEKDWDAEQRNNALEETKSTRRKRNKSGTDELDTTSAKGEDGGLVAVKTRSSMRKRDTEQSVISKTRSSRAKNVTAEEERKIQLEDCMLEEAKSTRNTRSKSANAKRNVSSTRRKTRSSNAEDTVPAEDKGIEKEISTVREPSKRQLTETVSCQPQDKGPKRTTKQAKHKQEGQVTAPKTGGTNKRRQDDSSVSNAPEPKRTTRSSTRIQEKLSSRK